MTTPTAPPRPWRRLLLLCGLCAWAGCGGGLTLVPVSGKVTLGGKAVPSGGVSFIADVAKGNNAQVICVGRLGPQGEYELKSQGVKPSDSGPGAPPGWYRVTIIEMRDSPLPKVPAKYMSEKDTPLSIEVLAEPPPGGYNFELRP
jgi:hypothetical protein